MMVMTEFPEHPWRPWEFKKSIKLWWQNLAEEEARGNEIAAAAVREYLLLLAEKLGVQHVKDIPFYNYPTVTLHLNYFGSIPALLSRLGLLEAQKQTSTESDFIQSTKVLQFICGFSHLYGSFSLFLFYNRYPTILTGVCSTAFFLALIS